MHEPLVAYEGILYWNLLKQHISTLEVAMGSTGMSTMTPCCLSSLKARNTSSSKLAEVIRRYAYSQM